MAQSVLWWEQTLTCIQNISFPSLYLKIICGIENGSRSLKHRNASNLTVYSHAVFQMFCLNSIWFFFLFCLKVKAKICQLSPLKIQSTVIKHYASHHVYIHRNLIIMVSTWLDTILSRNTIFSFIFAIPHWHQILLRSPKWVWRWKAQWKFSSNKLWQFSLPWFPRKHQYLSCHHRQLGEHHFTDTNRCLSTWVKNQYDCLSTSQTCTEALFEFPS